MTDKTINSENAEAVIILSTEELMESKGTKIPSAYPRGWENFNSDLYERICAIKNRD